MGDFAAEVKDLELLLNGFDMLHLEAFENQVGSWESKHKENKVVPLSKASATAAVKTGPKYSNFRRFYAAAAVVAALLFVPLGYSYMNQNSLDDYFTAPNINNNTTRSGTDTSKNDETT